MLKAMGFISERVVLYNIVMYKEGNKYHVGIYYIGLTLYGSEFDVYIYFNVTI